MNNYIIIERCPAGSLYRLACAYNIKIEQPGREDFRRCYVGYTKREAIKRAREACGLVGRHLVTIEL